MDKVSQVFCCLGLRGATEDSINSPITYDSSIRSFSISAPTALVKENVVWLEFGVNFCPFCGSKLPADLVDERMNILEKEYGIDDVYDEEQKKLIPDEFMTDEWWKKRKL